ncbi:hypothetical protein [Calycomorphotria hydatis]|uniref:Uncharacterized protein n=1 Tax=Calycomorphotria hydatis TaxID=2528027 RepID=A0A517TAS9_9PLAN|nr:hypothetical protein [Calycomorphotria hydatis]QDT65476.1 hypothetical protein V22_27300 [Calycomorphotria hydatis]
MRPALCITILFLGSLAATGNDHVVQAKLDQFPPEASAIYISGELTFIDHIKREAILRPDRRDSQQKKILDLPLKFKLLPYASVYFHGELAELRDIPIGTHVHGYFYLGEEGAYEVKVPSFPRSPHQSDLSPYSLAIRLEDDFSYYRSRGKGWRIDSFDRDEGKMEATLVSLTNGETEDSIGKRYTNDDDPCLKGTQIFEFDPSTRVWKGNSIASLDNVKPGQVIQFSLTWATLFGPGHCTDLWLDEASCKLAAEHQKHLHERYLQSRGVPAFVESVEHNGDGSGIVTAVLFDTVAPSILELFRPDTSGQLIVVNSQLRSYDQGNDFKGIRYLSLENSDGPPPGSSGVKVRFRCSELIEGVRPNRVVKLTAPGWPRIQVPREERLWPSDVR